MKPHTIFRVGVLFWSLTVLLLAGCAATRPAMRIGSGDIIADRQRLMKLNGASLQDIMAKAKAGSIGAIAVNAETIALNAEHIPALFPEGSLSEKSYAKPEIWQRWAEFTTDAKSLQSWAEKLRDAAKAKDTASTQAILKDFGRQACGACHTPFRKPLPS
jgi:cytochrome c556